MLKVNCAPWTEEETERLAELVKTVGRAARNVYEADPTFWSSRGRTRAAICTRIRKTYGSGPTKNKPLTDEEKAYILANYEQMGPTKISRVINRSVTTIGIFALANGAVYGDTKSGLVRAKLEEDRAIGSPWWKQRDAMYVRRIIEEGVRERVITGAAADQARRLLYGA